MEKARSRLRQPGTTANPEVKPTVPSVTRHQPAWSINHQVLQRYQRHWPTLILSVSGWFGVWFVLTRIYPTQVQNLPLPNSYGPLLLALLVAVTFTVAFAALNTRRGWWAGMITVIWTSAQLQNVVVPWWQWLILVTLVIGFELVYSSIKKRQNAITVL